jgi:hypothetical protein
LGQMVPCPLYHLEQKAGFCWRLAPACGAASAIVFVPAPPNPVSSILDTNKHISRRSAVRSRRLQLKFSSHLPHGLGASGGYRGDRGWHQTVCDTGSSPSCSTSSTGADPSSDIMWEDVSMGCRRNPSTARSCLLHSTFLSQPGSPSSPDSASCINSVTSFSFFDPGQRSVSTVQGHDN